MSGSVLGWLFLAVVWGSTWLVIKIGLSDLPPFTFAGIRFAIAAVVLLTVVRIRAAPMPRGWGEWWLIGATASVTISLQYGLQFWGQQYVASGLASVLTAMIPVFVMVFAHWSLPDEPMTARRVAGVAVSSIGVVIIFSDQLQGGGSLAFLGSVALVVGSGATARAQVAVKKYAGDIDPMTFTAWQMVLGSVPLLVLGLLIEGNPASLPWTARAVGAILYLAVVGSAAAFFVMYWLFRRMEVTKVLSVAFVNPLIAVLLGWMVLSEVLSWRAVAGGVGILLGLGLVLGSPAIVAVVRPAPSAAGVGRRSVSDLIDNRS